MYLAAKTQRHRRARNAIEADQRHGLQPGAAFATGFQAGIGHRLFKERQGTKLTFLAGSAAEKGVRRQGLDIGLDAVGRKRRRRGGGESGSGQEQGWNTHPPFRTGFVSACKMALSPRTRLA